MHILMLILALFWIVPLAAVAATALLAQVSPRIRLFVRRTLVTG